MDDQKITEEKPSKDFAVGIQYRSAGDIYTFMTDDDALIRGQHVVVEGEHGESVGAVIVEPWEIPKENIPKNVKRVVRRANEEDILDLARSREEARDFFDVCEKKIVEHSLPMKLIDTEIVEGGKKVIFFFFSEQRVDFRSLVKDLASSLHRYIEMRQIGSRDVSSFVGCMGPCGRTTCCSSHMRQFQSISIAMAKNQGLSPNPAKLTGMCGKLKCCLSYENKSYVALRKGLPKQNSWVQTPRGEGKVVNVDVLKQRCGVRLEGGGEARFDCSECKPAERKQQPQRGSRQDKQDKQGKPERRERQDRGKRSSRRRKSDSEGKDESKE